MSRFLVKWLINTLALFLISHIIAGIRADSLQSLIAAALMIGLLNAVIRPFIIMLTLPITILSFGLFTLFINGALFYMTSKLVAGFHIADFWSAFWAALFFSVISFLLNLFLTPAANLDIRTFGSAYRRDKKYDDAIDVEGKAENEDRNSSD